MCLSCVAWMPRSHGIADSGEDPRTVAAPGKMFVLKHRNLKTNIILDLIKSLGRIPLRGRPSQIFLAE